jgi:NAD(P)-dependent dehydrogenase (short-subunit alcohol dehydrogenase family)
MDLGFDNQVAVVTGGTKGIGLAVCTALVHEGATVVACARSEASSLPDGTRLVTADVTEPGVPEQLIATVLAEHSRIDVLVNNVGGLRPHPGGFLTTPDSAFQESFELNFYTAVRMCRAVLPTMVDQGSGAIINVSSVNAFLPEPSIPDYASSKAAMTALSKGLALEFASSGVRINTVSPGPVDTPLLTGEGGVIDVFAAAAGMDRRVILKGLTDRQRLPVGRISTPEEVASVILLLASGRTGTLTGSNVVIDGGLVKTV